MVDGSRAESHPLVVQRNQQLQIVPVGWKPVEDLEKSNEPIGAKGESGEPIGIRTHHGADLEDTAGLWNTVGIYAVGKRRLA
jgi:hypothetical protein